MNTSSTAAQQGAGRFLVAAIALALVGVLSLALMPMASLAPEGVDPELFRWLALVQPAMLAIISVLIGHFLARRVGLDAPLLRALVTRQPVGQILGGQLKAGVIGGLVSGIFLVGYMISASGDAPALELPLATKLLYGGITEEFIARWGLMSLGVWLAVKVSRTKDQPQSYHYWIGNFFAAALFAAGHFPVLFAASETVSPLLIVAVVAGNMLPALVFGWLFQKRGLEAAIIAHAVAHLVGTAYAAIS